jgi:methionyl-tRNA formyltransferase
MKIIFMGTPAFAVPSLKAIAESNKYQLTAVFTAPPKQQGRGLSMQNSVIHDLALQYDIPVFTPTSLKNQESLELVNSIEADIIVVVAYGFIVPKQILTAKKYGCLNIHPSKLPKYRGAAPLQRTIINGDLETAVCIMQMDEGLDTGAILSREDFAIPTNYTLQALHDKCAAIGAKLLLPVLDKIDSIIPIKQSEEGTSYAHKLQKSEGEIFWSDDAQINAQKIRGMNPWPGTYFFVNGKQINIIEAQIINIDVTSQYEPGFIIDHDECIIACCENALKLITVKPEGKKSMSGSDYLRGLRSKALKLLV